MGTVTEAASGSVSTGGASCTPAVPTGLTSGDMLVCKVSWVNSTMVKPTMPGDWTELVSGSGGSATAGNNVGGRGISIFYKETDGTDSGTVTVTSGSSTNAAITARITAYDKDSGTWDLAAQVKADTSAGTDYSITLDSDIGLAAGDYYFINTSYAPRANTPSSPTLSWSGVTFTGPNLNGSTANTNGWDVRQVNYDGAWSSGTSTGAPTFGFTASASIDGGCSAFVRLRAVSSTNYDGTSTIAATAATTSSGVIGKVATSSIAGTASVTTAGVVARTATASISASGSITAAGVVGKVATATITSTAATTSAGSVGGGTLNGTAALSATGSITATGVVAKTATAAITGTAATNAGGVVAGTRTSSVTATAAITATGVVARTSTATITGTATVAASGGGTAEASSSIAATATTTATGQVAGTRTTAVTATATITGTGQVGLSASSEIAATSTVATAPQVGLSGTVAVEMTGTIVGTVHTDPLGPVAGGTTPAAWEGQAPAGSLWGGGANGDRWAGGPGFQDIGGGA